MKVTLLKKEHLIGDVTSFWLKPEEEVTWQAGQYGKYVLDIPQPDEEGASRYFTISAAPFEEHLQITTRVRQSSFKQKLDSLEVGDQFELVKTGGDFVVEDSAKHYVFLAGGIGITPFRSILLDLSHNGEPLNVTLLYANRNSDVVFEDELKQLAERHLEFSMNILIDPERLDEAAIRQYVPDLSVPIFYVSGPVPMVMSLKDVLVGMGIDESRIKLDDFPGYEEI